MQHHRHLALLALALALCAAGQLAAAQRPAGSSEFGNSEDVILEDEGSQTDFDSSNERNRQSSQTNKGANPAGNVLAAGGNALSSLLGVKKEAPPAAGASQARSSKPEEKEKPAGAGAAKVESLGKPVSELVDKVVEQKSDMFSLNPLKNLGDFTKYLFNPLELVKSISNHFKLPLDKFIEKLGNGLVLGVEALLHPIVVTMKIVEKVFVPDACRLKFFCSMGTHLKFIRESVLRFSPSLLEGSSQLKALTDGIKGESCESVFSNCEMKLKKPFESLRNQAEGSTSSLESGYTSSSSPKPANKLLFGLM